MKPPTQGDVAKVAGVSRATVSYVLNSPPDKRIPISAETRQRVLDAVAELGYEPNARARSLRLGKTKTIGVLVPSLLNPYFVQLLHGMSSEAQAAGYSLNISQSSLTPAQESHSLKELAQQQVDGLILVMGFKRWSSHICEQLRNFNKPVVEITATTSEFDHVLNGYADGTRRLLAHLLELGHRKIGFVYGVADESQGYDRLLTYRQVLEDAGVQAKSDLVKTCSPTMEGGYRAAYQLLSDPHRPTALLAINDLLGVAVVRAAADMGLRIPDDVSVASFDNIPFVSYTVPRLTTVSSQPEQNGRAAVQLFLKRLLEPDGPCEVVAFKSELIIRESTGPPPHEVRLGVPLSLNHQGVP